MAKELKFILFLECELHPKVDAEKQFTICIKILHNLSLKHPQGIGN
jgi:hypothetical protein